MKKHWKWAIGIIAFCILVPAIETVVLAEMHFQARDETARRGSEFLAVLGTHEYEKAYAMLTISQQKMMSVNMMKIAEQQTEKTCGQPTGKAAVDEYHVDQTHSSATILYDSVYRNETHLVLVKLLHTDDGWRVLEYHYDYSPA